MNGRDQINEQMYKTRPHQSVNHPLWSFVLAERDRKERKSAWNLLKPRGRPKKMVEANKKSSLSPFLSDSNRLRTYEFI
ncbi:MAG: hypothetical protein B5M53_01150 [Candidatus Cloacimonas sp. 4484_209]|nr:MAG: hypothetical protein B5M53_01150 [Candidatus Cloacimonas sp. 4484_209]